MSSCNPQVTSTSIHMANQARLAFLAVTHRYKRAHCLWLEPFHTFPADSGCPRKRAGGAGGRTQITALCMGKRSGPETCSGVAHGPLESSLGWQPVTVAG